MLVFCVGGVQTQVIWCWEEIYFIATSFNLVPYLHEKFVIIWLVFEWIDWNLYYIYDIELGYYFLLLVVVDWAVVMLIWVFVIENLWCVYDCGLLFPVRYPCKIQNVNFKEIQKKNCKMLLAMTMSLLKYAIFSDDMFVVTNISLSVTTTSVVASNDILATTKMSSLIIIY